MQAFLGEQKISEFTFEILPPPDPYSIRGIVTGPDGKPLRKTAVEANRGEERFRVDADPDGSFEIVASSGVFLLEVQVGVVKSDGGIEYVFAGWYDGKGGITTYPTQAFEIAIDDEDVEEIDIVLPSDSYAIFRGSFTGPDYLRPAGKIALEATQGEEMVWIDTEPYATFSLGLPSGSYSLEIKVEVGSEWHFVGWYDGKGGITTDPNQASEVILDDAGLKRIDIVLPETPQDLLCPSGTHRSIRTGQCS